MSRHTFSSAWSFRKMGSMGKLGGCPRCMRSSAGLTVLAWALYVLLVLLADMHPMVRAIVLAAALALTSLTIAHLVAFIARFRRAVRASLDEQQAGTPAPTIQRRRFLVAAAQAAALVLFGPIVFRVRPAWAQTTQPSCPGEHAIVPPNLISVDTCVNRKNKDQRKTAQNQTQGKAKENAMAFAEQSCKTRSCPDAQDCVRDGVGFTLEFVECAPNVTRVCADNKNQEAFVCAWRVTAVKCKCQRS